jgi:hypothetical protein
MMFMDNNKRRVFGLYFVVGLLFLLVIVLWVYTGGWKRIANNQKQVTTGFGDIGRQFSDLWQKSQQRFEKMAPTVSKKEISKQFILDDLASKALGASVSYAGVVVRFPQNWLADTSSSTTALELLASDGEKFFITTQTIASTTEVVIGWHKLNNESIANWSWQLLANGFIGYKINNQKEARVVALKRINESTILIIERQSHDIAKLKDGLVEVLLSGLQK